MQFVLFIYQGTTPLPGSPEWDHLSEADQQAIYADYATLNRTPGVTGGLPLGLPAKATTVRRTDGVASTTPGPYLDHGGAVGGYLVVEADHLDAATTIAASIPAARLGGAVEVRPVATYW